MQRCDFQIDGRIDLACLLDGTTVTRGTPPNTQIAPDGCVRLIRKSMRLSAVRGLCTFQPLIAACGCPPGGESPAGDLQSS